MIVEYKSKQGLYIVRVHDGLYYYGNGKELNAFGISANHFLRFNPYMDYVKGNGEQPSESIKEWILDNQKGEQ